MATIVGGLRSRFVHDSLKTMIEDALEDIGWFDSGRRHNTVTVRSTAVPEDEEALPNIVALDLYDTQSEEVELGNAVLTTDTYYYAVDVYGENHSLGLHLAGDVRDIIRGKMSTIGRTGPTLAIKNLNQATPSTIATAHIMNVSMEKARMFSKPYQKFWWQIFLEIEDEYGDEAD